MKTRNVKYVIAAIVATAIVGLGIWLYQNQTDSRASASKALEQLEQRESSPEIMRLKDGLKPPTNRWFSSLVFGKTQTAFAYPLSYKAADSGFEVSVPKISSQSDVVTAPHTPDIAVNMKADSYVVSRYDDLSVTSSYNDLANVTVTQGSPFVFLRANKQIDLQVTLANATDLERPNPSTLLFRVNGQRYGIRANDINASGQTKFRLLVRQNGYAAFFAIPNNAADTEVYVAAAQNPLTGTRMQYQRKDGVFDTIYTLETREGQPTAFGGLPHHNFTNGSSGLGSFNTLYGALTMHSGREFAYTARIQAPRQSLDISRITDAQKDKLKQLLAADVSELALAKTDTYFGGKELYRAANLLQIANQLDEEDIRQQLQRTLRGALETWFSPSEGRSSRLFYYDRTLHGVVGVEPAFGSEEFNDHHFHYGYFIYAASILAKYDIGFVQEYGDSVEALVADIANTDPECDTPTLRTYDRFTGHSWASGFADFYDGNNQESSSEAVNAWYALYLWADVTKNDELKDTALWLYGNETNAAKQYWLRDQRNQSGFGEFEHPFVSLAWNGKRDYATFFSPRPQAMLGIQLIPMSPGHLYLQDTAVAKNLDTAPAEGQFADYLIMYGALANPEQALKQADSLQDSEIDDANSRTYLHAWVYSLGSR